VRKRFGTLPLNLERKPAMKHNRYHLVRALVVCAFFFLEAPICRANLIFNVTLGTSGLINHPAGPFYIDFQLNDGSGRGDKNNTVVIDMFKGGQAVGSPLPPIGGASGDLLTSVSITDSGFINEFTQRFDPSSTLSFIVNLTTKVDLGIPDAFTFSILDRSLAPIPTTNFADAFIFVNINSANLTPADLGGSLFRGDPNQAPLAGGDVISIGKPQIPGVSETGSAFSFFGLASLGIAALRRKLSC